jgi:MFS family permease
VDHSAATPTRADQHTPFQVWWLVGVLHLTYLLSFVDRTALSLLVEPIKVSLAVSDTQIGLLQGLAFGLLYALLGVPFGWAVDRFSRKGLVAAGVVFWSAATAWCGLARSYVELFAARTCVGIGEATLSPAAPSLIAETFPPHKRGLALGIYQSAASIGVGFALIAGGLVAKAVAAAPPVSIPGFAVLEPWRVVFLVLSAPGAIVAALLLTMKEPRRIVPPARTEHGHGLMHLMRNKRGVFGLHFAGFSLFTIFAYGALGWIPTYFVRVHQWEIAQVGGIYGLAFLVGGPLGAISGGALADAWTRQGKKAAAGLVMTVGVSAMTLVGTIAPLSKDAYVALGLFALVAFLFAFPSGASPVFLASLTPADMRGRVTALHYLVINLVGAALGATLIGILNDTVFQGPTGIAYSLSVLCAITCLPGAACLAGAWRLAARG